MVAFNITEDWARDASHDVAREIWRRTAGQERSEALQRFIDRHMMFPQAVVE